MSDNIIQTANLWKTYRDRSAVRELDLHIKKGDIYGFLGPNGAGKTTTIRMLLGLIKPTKGVIRVFDKDIRKDRMDILRRVGSLVEYPSYYGHLNAVENLEALRRILNVPKSRIAEVLSIVDLTRDAKRAVKGYSLGMKQRLGIASALLGQPELLILDEPTNGLDPAGIQEIRELIKRMPLEHGITVLVSSHLLSEVEQMASRVGIIREGKMVLQDTIANLHSQTGSSIRLIVSEPEEAMKLAREQGQFGQRQGSELTFPYMDNSAIALLVRRLVEQDHAIYRVEEHRQSLEDLFMRVIGEGAMV
ncbi:ABC transporter ATP-binding protein [Paenibacillus xylanilyticus]|uniref:ABC transporter ATP-binding protein n=1 Tax=Paenibacillus xylanilyticus TaxID=248903 RepID=UPI003AB0643F